MDLEQERTEVTEDESVLCFLCFLLFPILDPAKRHFVYCISHSRWNDGYASRCKFTCTKRSDIEQHVHWVQIRDQNRLLSFGRYGRPSTPEEFEPYFWMRDSKDAKIRWLWERMVVSTRPDPSDAGMTWFLATGDEECDPVKLRRLVDEHRCPAPVTARRQVRIEAENIRHLEGCTLDDRGWMSRTIRDVAIRRGDEIRVDFQAADAAARKLDYVQLRLPSPESRP